MVKVFVVTIKYILKTKNNLLLTNSRLFLIRTLIEVFFEEI